MIALISRVMASREGFAYVVMTSQFTFLIYLNEGSHKKFKQLA